MNRTTILAAFLLLVAPIASAGPNWQVGTFTMDPANTEKLLAATDKLMSGKVGKSSPGTVSVMVNVIDGADPSTHSFISSFDSVAEREAFITKLRASPEWAPFLKQYTAMATTGSNSRMNLVKSWGKGGPEDVVWHIHIFEVEDAEDFVEALDTLMASGSAKGFPGQLHLSAIAAAGVSQASHLLSVGYESEAEAEAWTDKLTATKDWDKYVDASGDAAEFGGTYIIRALQTWGSPSTP